MYPLNWGSGVSWLRKRLPLRRFLSRLYLKFLRMKFYTFTLEWKVKYWLTNIEKEGVVVFDTDVQHTLTKDQFCLVGKIMTERKINHENFRITMLKVWKVGNVIRIVEIGVNLFLLEFNEQDFQRVWDGQPWLFDQNLLYLKFFYGHELVSSHAYFWVQLHNLPLECLNHTMGSQIGRMIGNII